MELDVLGLSRLQFAATIGFHILFPTLTIALSCFVVALEAAWLATGAPVYLTLYRFWVKLFALSFGMGVVSGIVLSYEVGTNFARFAEATGPVLGPLFAAEVLTAFFVEAGFLGVMLFGWDKVGPRLHFLATALVAAGTLASAFWILAANSWMQTPAGAALEAGRFAPLDWWEIVFSPSFPYRLAHMLLASFLTTSFVVAGIAAWWLLRGRGGEAARRSFSIALAAAAVFAPLQILAGDLHGQQVHRDQPMKVAAMEALWRSTRGAPFLVFALPDQAAAENRYALAVPHGTSLLLTHEWNGAVAGLDRVAPRDRPFVPLVFWSFRLMVAIGFALLGVALWGLWERRRGRLADSRPLQRACLAASPLGFVATVAGWVVAETGRQPWTVQGLLRTADSVSPLVTGEVATSLTAFALVYGLVFSAYVGFLARIIRAGPEGPPAQPGPEAMRGARPASVTPGE